MRCRRSWKVIRVTKRCNSTLLWSALDGVQCRMAAYEEDQCQVMLLWQLYCEQLVTTCSRTPCKTDCGPGSGTERARVAALVYPDIPQLAARRCVVARGPAFWFG